MLAVPPCAAAGRGHSATCEHARWPLQQVDARAFVQLLDLERKVPEAVTGKHRYHTCVPPPPPAPTGVPATAMLLLPACLQALRCATGRAAPTAASVKCRLWASEREHRARRPRAAGQAAALAVSGGRPCSAAAARERSSGGGLLACDCGTYARALHASRRIAWLQEQCRCAGCQARVLWRRAAGCGRRATGDGYQQRRRAAGDGPAVASLPARSHDPRGLPRVKWDSRQAQRWPQGAKRRSGGHRERAWDRAVASQRVCDCITPARDG